MLLLMTCDAYVSEEINTIMNIRFYNCRILTMEDGKDIIKGELHVGDGWITYVGTGGETETAGVRGTVK